MGDNFWSGMIVGAFICLLIFIAMLGITQMVTIKCEDIGIMLDMPTHKTSLTECFVTTPEGFDVSISQYVEYLKKIK